MAPPSAKNRPRLTDRNANLTILPIVVCVGRVIAEPIIAAQFLGDLSKRLFSIADGVNFIIPPAAHRRQVFQILRRIFIVFANPLGRSFDRLFVYASRGA